MTLLNLPGTVTVPDGIKSYSAPRTGRKLQAQCVPADPCRLLFLGFWLTSDETSPTERRMKRG